MSDQQIDPFTLVYNGLWTLIERNQKLVGFIERGNRIKYESYSEIKPELGEADTPELALLVSGGGFGNANNTSQKSCQRDFIWALTSGNFSIGDVFLPIQWEIFRSMSDWECVLCNLQWCNCKFVSDCQLIAAEDGTSMSELTRNIPGWASLWTARVSMQFPIQSLKIT